MSDAPPPGWWQASDGRWYPPESAPSQQPPQPPPGQPPYVAASPYGSPYEAPPQTASTATLSLVLSILSFVVCPVVLAIAGLITASKAANDIRASGGRLTGAGLVTASRVIAIINIVLSALAIGGMVLLISYAADGSRSSVDFGLDAADQARDSAATASLLTADGAQLTYYTDNARFSDNPEELRAIEPSIHFVRGSRPSAEVVVVALAGPQVTMGIESVSGTCFYIRRNAMTGATYAQDQFCGAFDEQSYTVESWAF